MAVDYLDTRVVMALDSRESGNPEPLGRRLPDARSRDDAGQLDETPRAYLARAWRCAAASPIGMAVAAISTRSRRLPNPGPMKLYLCDMALERARLALWRSHGFAPRVRGAQQVEFDMDVMPTPSRT